MRALALVVLAALTLCSCSTLSGTSANAPSGESPELTSIDPGAIPTSGMPTPVEAPNAEQGQPFTARPDIIRAVPAPVESWKKIDDRTLAIQFVTGTPECYGADVTVTETDEAVTLALRTGTLPEAKDKMCIALAVVGTLEVTLDAPLGDRTVLNAG